MSNEKLEAGLASDLNRELDKISDDCKLCGSSCNERDELYEALQDLLNDCINFSNGELTEVILETASGVLKKYKRIGV